MHITPDNHASAVIEAFEYRGVIVLIHEAGRYPAVTAPDGRCTKTCPHIKISICWDYPHVTAIAGYRSDGRLLALPINDHLSRKPADQSREGLIAYGKTFLDQAVEAIPTIAQMYDDANAIYSWVASLPSPLTREAYESACAERGIDPIFDLQLSRFGDFSFPAYDLNELPRALLHQKRAFAVEQETAAAEAARRAEDRLRRDVLIAEARQRPIKKTIRRLEAPNYQSVGAAHIKRDGTLWVCMSVERARRIGADDPSIHGEHLLGSEGAPGLWVTWNVH